MGKASISARRPTLRFDAPLVIVATTPVPPTPATKGMPISLSFSQTKAAVPVSLSDNSGWA